MGTFGSLSSTASSNRTFRVDTTAGLKGLLPALRDKLKRDPAYFTKVYQHTFNFAREEGQRSLREHAGFPSRPMLNQICDI
jgi:transposase-like protein